jgi:hypothetical protein
LEVIVLQLGELISKIAGRPASDVLEKIIAKGKEVKLVCCYVFVYVCLIAIAFWF